jgi:predicted nucleic acid-binding protein
MAQAYLDANVIIYLVEGTPKSAVVRQQLHQIGDPLLCSSYFALCECLVQPLRNNDERLVHAYELFFRNLIRVPTRPSVFRLAAKLRAASNLRTPDALHLAYACSASCDYFVTGDQRLANNWTAIQPSFYPLQIIVI